MLEIVKMKLSSYIKNYFLSTDLKSFTNEIQTVLKYMIQNRAPQLSIEKVSIYVLKLLEFSSQIYEGNFLETMQIKQQRCIKPCNHGGRTDQSDDGGVSGDRLLHGPDL